jgi:hypothetical protein
MVQGPNESLSTSEVCYQAQKSDAALLLVSAPAYVLQGSKWCHDCRTSHGLCLRLSAGVAERLSIRLIVFRRSAWLFELAGQILLLPDHRCVISYSAVPVDWACGAASRKNKSRHYNTDS